MTDLTGETLQQWMDDMAANDLALSTMRTRQAMLSSLCAWLVKRGILTTNPVAKMDRPPHRSEPPRQVPSGALMDALVEAAQQRQRPRDLAVFLILRYSGMRRESVATLRVRHLDATWGLRGVMVKGGRTRDIPLPAAVMQFLWTYVEQVVSPQGAALDADTPIFWSSWGRRGVGKGLGTNLHFIREWGAAGPADGVVGAIIRDAVAGQHLQRLASIRRRNVHPGEPPRSIATTLSDAAAWLGKILGADPPY